MRIVDADKIVYEYEKQDENGQVVEVKRALNSVSLQIEAGQFIAILGHNGSGKSTLAKHINALLHPTDGTIHVCGMNTREEEHLWEIRKSAGMVFQNPDNQIIATVVEEDVGFGPENLGVPTEEIWRRVEESLKAVGMYEYRATSPNKLSGGQKQRVAVAGIMAMKPKCIILDEPTAMLDPVGRKEVLDTVKRLNREEGITVLLITHYMNEAIDADRVIVMEHGEVVLSGTPEEIFSQVERLQELRLDVPQVTELTHLLRKREMMLPADILTIPDFVDAYRSTMTLENGSRARLTTKVPLNAGSSDEKTIADTVLELSGAGYVYNPETAYERVALRDISLTIGKGEFIGLIGHTGSGKSTLIQLMNGLERPTSGTVCFHGQDIFSEGFSRKELRSKVGLVFQYPEHQLFESTVLEDVCFGPKNQGLSKEEALERAKEALRLVRADESIWGDSPLELSGGQKRRVAIAGVLAMHPEVLILDEPTAGLDPVGRDEILGEISRIHEETGMTVVLVSHSMEDVAKYAERLLVMNQGELIYQDAPREVFRYYKDLEQIGLAAPQITYLAHALQEAGLIDACDAMTVEEMADYLLP